jgi:putative ABC transport system ATP-binding protein/macrolide transport system ATP-binding/permease protein/lipoprotein-releasing system ATP-binding protein
MRSSRRKGGDVLLSAQSLGKSYGAAPGYEAVRKATLELRAGEFVSIVGRSGSGKSTLMAMLGALTRPTQGKVLLDGNDLWMLAETELASFRCRQIGFVFQFPSLLPSLSIVDNVALPALLGRTADAQTAYARAYRLLARVGLANRAHVYPPSMSGGEQRRAVVARALINSPRLLLADEPTSDLDEDSERDIIGLLEELQRTESFALALVTHSLELARRAQRSYEMREGTLAATDLAGAATTPPQRPRRFGAPEIGSAAEPAAAAAEPAPIPLGGGLWRATQTFLLVGMLAAAGILLLNLGIGKYQQSRVLARAARTASLQHMALNGLRGDVKAIVDLGDGRYDLTTYLQNVGGGYPIYVMTPDVRAYVQVGAVWQEVPTTPADESRGGVVKIEDIQTYRYLFEAQVKQYAQLLPSYMHVRFSATMLVSPRKAPQDDVFERKDNYYVYLKPFDVADDVVLKRMKFSGRPPVWIPMPPH